LRKLKWSDAYCVRVADLDDEHKALFGLVEKLGAAVAAKADRASLRECVADLRTLVNRHFRHEERLMHTTGYSLEAWHTRQHDAARRRAAAAAPGLNAGDPQAITALLQFMTGWMDGHIRIADRMFAAYLQVYRSSHRSFAAAAR
jgi:hemerythrin-like metal-binding protein